MRCPLYPQERTFSEAAWMSAKCQKRTFSPSPHQAFGAVLVLHAGAAQMSLGASLRCPMPTRFMTPAICSPSPWTRMDN